MYGVVFKSSNLLFAVVYAYSLYFDFNSELFYKLCPVPGFYLSKFAWLTFINLNLHLIYNTLASFIALFHVSNLTILYSLYCDFTCFPHWTGHRSLLVIILFGSYISFRQRSRGSFVGSLVQSLHSHSTLFGNDNRFFTLASL